MKKKILNVLIIGVFVFALTGCGNASNEDNKKTMTPNNSSSTITDNNTNNYIGEEQAKQIALSDAGLNVSTVSELFVEIDDDKNVVIYEVDFKYDGKEYDYNIDAISGEILSKKTEIDN